MDDNDDPNSYRCGADPVVEFASRRSRRSGPGLTAAMASAVAVADISRF
jgi:hypothetical protein